MGYVLVQALIALACIGRSCAAAPYPTSRAISHPGGTSNDKTVIVQMFEWTWDSVAAECKNFIGPAGYGYVQGASIHLEVVIELTDTHSEPSGRARHRQPVVDGLPASFVYPQLEARKPRPVREHGVNLQRCWSWCHCWYAFLYPPQSSRV